MPTFTTAVTASAAAAAAAAYDTFHTGANRPARLREKRHSTTVATYTPIGLIFASNTPVATTSTTPQPHGASSVEAAATCALDTAWSTAPTVAAIYLETLALGPAQGQVVIETYPLDGQGALTIPKSTYICEWNFSAAQGGAMAVTWIYDE
jgi:hypothetical protein